MKNKETLQLLLRQFLTEKSANKSVKIILSCYVIDEYGMSPCIEIIEGEEIEKPILNSMIEGADCQIIPHIGKAIMNDIERVLIYKNDTDVVVYLLNYVHISFKILVLRSSGLNMELEAQQVTSQHINLLISWGQIFANLYLRLMYCLDVM